MKINKFFAAALAALTLFSCSKNGNDDVTPTPEQEGQKATLTVTVSNPGSKAGGTVMGVDLNKDNKINDFTVFAFRASGKLDAMFTISGNNTGSGTATTAAAEVYVVANTGDLDLSSVTSKNELLAVVGDLFDGGILGETSQFYNSQANCNVWASGSSPIDLDTYYRKGDTYAVSVDVPLTFVSAKINVTVANNMTNRAASGAFRLTGVAVLNAGGTTKLFGDTGESLIPAIPYYHYYSGIENMEGENFKYIPALGKAPYFCNYEYQSFLFDAISDNGSILDQDKFHYYVFENNADAAEEFPTIVTLIGTWKGQTRYFPIHLTSYDGFKVPSLISNYNYVNEGIKRGHSYNVTLTLKGDAGTEVGTTDPTMPYEMDIDVSVSVNEWIPVVIEKEFN